MVWNSYTDDTKIIFRHVTPYISVNVEQYFRGNYFPYKLASHPWRRLTLYNVTLSSPYLFSYIYVHKHAYTCILIRTYIYTHTYIHTNIYTYTHIHTFTHTYTHSFIHSYIHTCIHTHIHIHADTHIHTRIHTYKYKLNTYIHESKSLPECL
jgi:hypothetical protein